jgi:hypothetical protein
MYLLQLVSQTSRGKAKRLERRRVRADSEGRRRRRRKTNHHILCQHRERCVGGSLFLCSQLTMASLGDEKMVRGSSFTNINIASNIINNSNGSEGQEQHEEGGEELSHSPALLTNEHELEHESENEHDQITVFSDDENHVKLFIGQVLSSRFLLPASHYGDRSPRTWMRNPYVLSLRSSDRSLSSA